MVCCGNGSEIFGSTQGSEFLRLYSIVLVTSKEKKVHVQCNGVLTFKTCQICCMVLFGWGGSRFFLNGLILFRNDSLLGI